MSDTEQTHKAETKKKIYKKWWFWVIVILLLVAFSPKDSSKQAETDTKSKTSNTAQADNSATITGSPEDQQSSMKQEEPSVPTEYKSALAKASQYSSVMHMSKQGVYDQLTSEYGEKFTAEAAQYGIDNVKADWNANALAKAKDYQDSMHMSPSAIRDQLVSSYGEKFTASEADYAIQHLNN